MDFTLATVHPACHGSRALGLPAMWSGQRVQADQRNVTLKATPSLAPGVSLSPARDLVGPDLYRW